MEMWHCNPETQTDAISSLTVSSAKGGIPVQNTPYPGAKKERHIMKKCPGEQALTIFMDALTSHISTMSCSFLTPGPLRASWR